MHDCRIRPIFVQCLPPSPWSKNNIYTPAYRIASSRRRWWRKSTHISHTRQLICIKRNINIIKLLSSFVSLLKVHSFIWLTKHRNGYVRMNRENHLSHSFCGYPHTHTHIRPPISSCAFPFVSYYFSSNDQHKFTFNFIISYNWISCKVSEK